MDNVSASNEIYRNGSYTDDNATQFVRDILLVNERFKPIVDYLSLAMLIAIMLSIGCEITWLQLKSHVIHPTGIIIGLASQFFIIPLTAYTLMRSTDISGIHATGVFIIACCPDGILSNLYAYFCDGDLSLSLVMTSFSTLLAMGMLPINLWIYGQRFQTKNLVLPYENLFWSLISIVTPVIFAMVLKWKIPHMVRDIKRVLSCVSFLVAITCMILIVIHFPEMFTSVSKKICCAILILPLIGFFVGYILAFSFRQSSVVRKTIAIVCGVHNTVTAPLYIISASFKPELQRKIILLPWLYSFAVISGYTVLVIGYQIYRQYASQKRKKVNSFNLELTGDLPMESITEMKPNGK